MPVTGRCTNFDNCTKADSKELLTVPDGSKPECPECGTEISVQLARRGDSRKTAILGVAGAVIAAALVYFFWPPQALPVITGPQSATGTVGQRFEIQIKATNEPTSYEAQDLPPDLMLDPKTGVIFGIPKEAKKSSITLSATNAAGQSTPAPFSLTIAQPPGLQEPKPQMPPGVYAPDITSSPSARGVVGQAFTYQIITKGNPQPRYEVTGNLPPGLTANPMTGMISGRPEQQGRFPVTLRAENLAGLRTRECTIMIDRDDSLQPPVQPPVQSPSAEQLATARYHFQQGLLFANANPARVEEAIQEFSAAIAAVPTYAVAYTNRGTAYILQKRYNKALDALNMAVKLDPQDKTTFYNLAVAYTLLKQFDRAIDALDQALTLGFSDASQLRSAPDLAELRKQPEFRKLIERHKIPYVLKP